ncbi:MAG: putative bifunctional diguanylate cyclase/phosphodiesterase [Geminicoccales bacterium]
MTDTAPDSCEKPIILVADDDEMQRFLIGEALEAEGFEVHLVDDGRAAVDFCKRLHPDVVLLDVIMPNMNGFEACSAIRMLPHGEQLPIVMVTGQEDIGSIATAYEAGATDFIAKPLNWTLLRHRIRYVSRAGATFKQLHASEMRLAEAQRIACLGSWEWYPDDARLDGSAEVRKMFNLPAMDTPISLSDLLDQIHPEDRGSLRADLDRLITTETAIAGEVRTNPKGSTSRFIEVHATVCDSGPQGAKTIRGTFQDVTERRLTEARLHHLDHHDALTGLPNRPLFHERLGQALERARREGIDAAVLCIDIDRFKDINDSLGHAVGDVLLQNIATRLQNQVRGIDTVARLGGDSFAVAQVGLLQPTGAERLTSRLLDALREPFQVEGHELFIDANVGVAIGPHDAGDPEQLLIKADIALHGAKEEGRGLCHFFEGGMDVAFRARKQIEQDLRTALAEGWFELFYQPQVGVREGRIVGVEALIRLRHPENGLLMPDHFIPIAEESGMIIPIGDWVLRQACAQVSAWQKQGLSSFRVAVNLSPAQFRESDLAETISAVLAGSGLAPSLLEVEITENVLIRETRNVVDVLHKLKKLGVQIAMDDFGTGYSSLSYLLRFPFDRIKIDRSFVKDITENPDAAAIVGAVVALGRRLNMSITAEGVETPEQLAYLKREDCHEVQGYYFGRPMPADAITDLLAEDFSVSQQAACLSP